MGKIGQGIGKIWSGEIIGRYRKGLIVESHSCFLYFSPVYPCKRSLNQAKIIQLKGLFLQ